MLRILFFALIYCFSLAGSAQNRAQSTMKGLLWEISGNGSTKPSYLYGTMHVSEKLAFNLSDSFFIALHNVDYVGLETDCEKWQEFQRNLAEFKVEGGGRRRNYNYGIEPNLYTEKFVYESPNNELIGAMLSFKPYLTNEFLYRSESNEDYEENTYLDLFIHQAGKKLGKKVIGLETVEGSYESAMRASFPPENEDEEIRFNRVYVSRSQIEEAYRSQDLDLMDSLDQLISPGKHYRKWMLDERNVVMANGIDSIIKLKSSIFAAVGAAHLPSDLGVINLLRKKGYTVRPVTFNLANIVKEKEKIDKIHYPVNISRQWAADSSWSVDAPGKFYTTIAENTGFSQHLYADMSNGVYYAVYKVKTFGFWRGQDADYIKSRIDSMIYERIPGKIQERKSFTQPCNGIEITTRTTKGDILKYKILITPYDIILFVTGGNSDYALGEEASRFINSVALHHYQPIVKPVSTIVQPKHGGFRAVFPATLQINTFDDKEADLFIMSTQNPVDSAVYFLTRGEYHDHNFIEEDSFELNIIGEKIAEGFSKQKPQVRLIDNKIHPTQELKVKADIGRFAHTNKWIHVKIVIDGASYYVLGCQKNNDERPHSFFDNFSIEPLKYPYGWVEKKDTLLDYKAIQPVSDESTPPYYIERLQKMYKEADDRRIGGYSNVERYKHQAIESLQTGEFINLVAITMPPASSYPSLDSLKRLNHKIISNNNKFFIKEEKWIEKNGMLIADFLVTDTNSTRGIKTKLFFHNRKEYRLTTVINTAHGETEFVQKVYSSFMPTDSLSNEKIFGARNLKFLEDIYAQDSLKKKEALKELDNIWAANYQKEDFDVVLKAVKHPDFGKLKFRERAYILKSLGKTKSEKVAPWFISFYYNYPDSVRYQLLAINELAECKTKESYQALLKILLKNPYVRGEFDQSSAYTLSDSLELSASVLMPDLMKLIHSKDWSENLYDLCYLMYKKNLVKPKLWAKQKSVLIQNVKNDLLNHRRDLESKKEDNTDRYYSYRSMAERTLRRNLILLAPFLNKDRNVKELMEQVMRLGDDEFKIMVYGLYLQHGVSTPASDLQSYAEKKEMLATLYSELVRSGKINQYPKTWFNDTVALVQSYFFGVGMYGTHIDSVRFLSKHPSKVNGKPVWLYLFDIKRTKEKNWTLAYANVPMDMSFLVNRADNALTDILHSRLTDEKGRYHNLIPQLQYMNAADSKTKEEFIRKKISEARFDGRQRYDVYNQGYEQEVRFEF